MTKQEFIKKLRDKLSYLPQEEVEERISFYSEMIDDRIEEGLSEEKAVASIETTDDISKLSSKSDEDPHFCEEKTEKQEPAKNGQSIKEKAHKIATKLPAWAIVLLVLASPIWISLLAAAFSVAVSIAAAAFALVVTIWAGFASLVAVGIYGIIVGVIHLFSSTPVGFALLGAGLASFALAVFFCVLGALSGKGFVALIKLICQKIKGIFTKKEARHE